MIDFLFREKLNEYTLALGRLLAKTRLSPNQFTVLGFLLGLPALFFFATKELFLAGFFVVFSSLFDVFDGAVARATGRVSRFGNYFDAVVDKYQEGLFLVGAGAASGETLWASLALLGAIMCSYARHRVDYSGEKLSDRNKVGVLERGERVAVLALGCFLNALFYALVILAVLANFSALLRIINAKKILEEE